MNSLYERVESGFACMRPGVRYAAVFGLILMLSLAAYSDSFNADFHFDDNHQIVKNHYMRSVKGITKFFTNPRAASYTQGPVREYRPVLITSYLLSYTLSGGKPWGFHLVNFGLHVVNAFLVYIVVSAVLVETGRRGTVVPLAAALIFALHPAQTSAVTYISARSALMATFFFL